MFEFSPNDKHDFDHFTILFNNEDMDCIKDLANKLETDYKALENKLDTKLNNKIIVKVYPNIAIYHSSRNQYDLDDSIVAHTYRNTIHIVSPLNPGSVYNYNDLILTATHELIHIFVNQIKTSSIPIWLSEGFAVYESNQFKTEFIDLLKQCSKKNYWRDLYDLESNDFNAIGGYIFSYSIIEFIVNYYGYNNLLSIIRDYSKFTKILGDTKETFQMKWKNYCQCKYST